MSGKYQSKLALYNKLVSKFGKVERKGKNNPYTSINGHMFSYFSRDGIMGLRLPKDEREKFIKEFNSKLFEQYGAVMKEYVEIPDKLLKNTTKLLPYLKKSYSYVSKLKPK